MNLAAIRPVETPESQFRKTCERLHYLPISRRIELKREMDRLQQERNSHRDPDEKGAEELVWLLTRMSDDVNVQVRKLRADGWTYRQILRQIEAVQGAGAHAEHRCDDNCAPDWEILKRWEDSMAREEADRMCASEGRFGGLQYGVPEPWEC